MVDIVAILDEAIAISSEYDYYHSSPERRAEQ